MRLNYDIANLELLLQKEQSQLRMGSVKIANLIFLSMFVLSTQRLTLANTPKGTPVTILGKLTQNKWEDDKGKHSRVVVVVNECVLPPKGTNTSGNDSSPATGKNTSSQTHSDDMAGMFGEEIVFDESGLPF